MYEYRFPIEIDGIVHQVPRDTTILEAAEQIGISIPTLCHLKGLAPDGSCRLCVVEAENRRGLFPACSTLCWKGMVVHTNSEKVVEARRFVLELLLQNHRIDCFSCPQNGGCKLQEYCYEYGVKQPASHCITNDAKQDCSSPFFTYDPSLCILCRRCERTCSQLQGRSVLSMEGRGSGTRMSIPFGRDWSQSDCESCGNCVANCPTGALTPKYARGFRTWEVQRVLTTCPHCAIGCQLNLLVKNGKLMGAEPADGPSNHGLLCVKGRFASFPFVQSGDRLKYPLIRRDGRLERASWDEALDLIVSRFKAIAAKYGADALAGFSCSRAPNEDNYLFQKMMRAAFGTNNVDNCARVCHSASVHGLAMTLGSGAMTNPIDDITTDVDVILLVGSNPTEAHPVIGTQIRRAVRQGTKLIVVDPRRIDLTQGCALHLPIRPGTNVAFVNGMIHVILEEGLEDREFIGTRTEGFEVLRDIVRDYTPERVGEICHISPDDLREAARLYAKAEKAPIIYCLGVTEHSTGTEGVMSLSNLAMVVGKIGRSGCGVNPLRGQNNVQGACDMGCLPNQYPGYQTVNDPKVQAKFEQAWGVQLPSEEGLTATQVLPAALEGKIKGLFIFGEDPMVTDPDSSHVRKELESLEFLVVDDLFLTETAMLADVVLPGVSYAEKEGTFTNTERRLMRVRKAVEPVGEAMADTDIFSEIMGRMGYPCRYDSAAAIMDEIASVTPSFGGISHKRLDAGEWLQWPCPAPDHPGTAILHEDRFLRGLGWFYPAQYQPSAELPDGDYPLLLITGRMLYHYNTRAMTGRSEGINRISDRSYIEINEQDAKVLGIRDGDRVRVESRRGELETTARVGDRVSEGEVFMTFHFPDGNANKLTNSVTDEIAHIPEYKVCACKIIRADAR